MMRNNCPPIFPKIMEQEDQIKYITTIVKCEVEKNDSFLVEYFAVEMLKYLIERLKTPKDPDTVAPLK